MVPKHVFSLFLSHRVHARECERRVYGQLAVRLWS